MEEAKAIFRLNFIDDLSHSHTGSYDVLIARLVAIWRTCDRSAMFATISRSRYFLWWCVIVRFAVRMVAPSTTIGEDHRASGSHKRSIVRSIVAPDDRSYDQSWNYATDSVGRRMGSDLNPRNISTFYSVSEQSIGGTTGRKVARPVARLIVRPLTIWNRTLQVLNMTIELLRLICPLRSPTTSATSRTSFPRAVYDLSTIVNYFGRKAV